MPRRPKSENGVATPPTSYKISDRHKFLLHLIARQDDKNYTQVLEEAIEEIAPHRIKLGVSPSILFDIEPAVRMLNCLAQPKYRANAEEDELLSLIRAHKEFWYQDKDQTIPKRDFAVILWPNRKRYVDLWRKRERDYWAAAEAMAKDLRKARPDLKLPKYGDK